MNMDKIVVPFEDRKNVRMTIRISPKISKWFKDNQISPQRIFDEAVEELQEQK